MSTRQSGGFGRSCCLLCVMHFRSCLAVHVGLRPADTLKPIHSYFEMCAGTERVVQKALDELLGRVFSSWQLNRSDMLGPSDSITLSCIFPFCFSECWCCSVGERCRACRRKIVIVFLVGFAGHPMLVSALETLAATVCRPVYNSFSNRFQPEDGA